MADTRGQSSQMGATITSTGSVYPPTKRRRVMTRTARADAERFIARVEAALRAAEEPRRSQMIEGINALVDAGWHALATGKDLDDVLRERGLHERFGLPR